MNIIKLILATVVVVLAVASTSCGGSSGLEGEYFRTPEKPKSKPGKMDILRMKGGGLTWGYYNPNYKDGAFDEELRYKVGKLSRNGETFSLTVEDGVAKLTGTITKQAGKRVIRFEMGEQPEGTSSYTYNMLAKAFGTDPWVEVD